MDTDVIECFKKRKDHRMSIRNIEIFVKLRETLLLHKYVSMLVEQVEIKLFKQDEEIDVLFTYLGKFIEKEEVPRMLIGYKTKED